MMDLREAYDVAARARWAEILELGLRVQVAFRDENRVWWRDRLDFYQRLQKAVTDVPVVV